MKLYQIAHFYALDVYIASFVKNLNFWTPHTKNSDFSDFSGILVLFSTEISRSGTNIPSLNINHLLERDKCFLTIYKQILYLALFPRYKICIAFKTSC